MKMLKCHGGREGAGKGGRDLISAERPRQLIMLWTVMTPTFNAEVVVAQRSQSDCLLLEVHRSPYRMICLS